MAWWGWFVCGALLLGSELAFVDAQFYFVFLGLAALLVGFLTFALPGVAAWLQWGAFGVLSVASLALFRRAIYERIRGNAPGVKPAGTGEDIHVAAELPAGASCQVEYRGSFWTATNIGHDTIAAGGRARIVRIENLTLMVRPD